MHKADMPEKNDNGLWKSIRKTGARLHSGRKEINRVFILS